MEANLLEVEHPLESTIGLHPEPDQKQNLYQSLHSFLRKPTKAAFDYRNFIEGSFYILAG